MMPWIDALASEGSPHGAGWNIAAQARGLRTVGTSGGAMEVAIEAKVRPASVSRSELIDDIARWPRIASFSSMPRTGRIELGRWRWRSPAERAASSL
jgi:hypothetical protein